MGTHKGTSRGPGSQHSLIQHAPPGKGWSFGAEALEPSSAVTPLAHPVLSEPVFSLGDCKWKDVTAPPQ